MKQQENVSEASGPQRGDPNRRGFLRSVAGAAAGAAAVGHAARTARGAVEADPDVLPTVPLGRHRISRLILGGNPIYGYSHFNRLYSQHLRDYHTPERVVELLQETVAAGINTWQNSYAPRTVADVERCRSAGVAFNWLLLGKPDWEHHPETVDVAARLGPIGIAPHGSLADRLHRENRHTELVDLLKRIRDTGVLVGLSAHNPALVELAEERGWDIDYYMCCLYYRTRPQEEIARLLGEAPIGEVYLPGDRKRMLNVVHSTPKTCLVYKLFAAGRLSLSPAGIRANFEETLRAIKPTDAMIVGMFQEFGDQVRTNANTVRKICEKLA